MTHVTWSFHNYQIGEATRECWPAPGEFMWGDKQGDEPLPLWGTPNSSDATQRLIYAAAGLLVEGLTGRRPFSQLARWLPTRTLNRLQLLAHRDIWATAKIRRAMGSETSVGLIHAVALIDIGSRVVAATLRLRRVNSSWRCERADLLWAGSHLSAG